MQMMPMTQNAKPAINTQIQKAQEENDIGPRAYKKFLLRKYKNNSVTTL